MQILELGIPTVMSLNIFDEAEAKGYKIDVAGIAKRLGITVIPTAATKNRGLQELLTAVLATFDSLESHKPRQLGYGEDIDTAINWIGQNLQDKHPQLANRYPLRWLACKLMEGDAEVAKEVNLSSDEISSEAMHP